MIPPELNLFGPGLAGCSLGADALYHGYLLRGGRDLPGKQIAKDPVHTERELDLLGGVELLLGGEERGGSLHRDLDEDRCLGGCFGQGIELFL